MQEKTIALYRAATAFSIMTASGLLASSLRLLSFGLLTEFNRRYLVASSSRLILLLIGVRVKYPPLGSYPREQVMYTFNHNSFLDVLLITALGIPNTRVLLSEKTLKIWPVTISAFAIGTLYIPLKTDKQRRLQFFKKLTNLLAKKEFCVMASSEGVHRFIHGIAPFNKGIYHVASQRSLPVIPLYLHIPEKTNSLEGYKFNRGTIRIEMLPAISTATWELANLKQHVCEVRKIFVDKFRAEHQIV